MQCNFHVCIYITRYTLFFLKDFIKSQVLNDAWDVNIPVACKNVLWCYHREGYNKILKNGKRLSDPVGRHLSAFTLRQAEPSSIGETQSHGV